MRLFLDGQPHTFDPETLHLLGEVLDEAWNTLQSANEVPRTDNGVGREALAQCIVDAAKEGELDRRRLVDKALARFRL